ncbi:FmdE family protein [Desulfosarcina ovata]|uniref:Formylmethanofuran dehydrogenase subunit E n=2 Tax=Desulfosarcina ovata TaxID=83564 RepID=A0A5K8AE88_9BACT|nr:FmdE family protein [Desulfosarcina ovata]BBO83048.1 formylmethanofuran dehydrogenase subunit E [Desulfosarcina ovata subsp. sediminis]BBO90270.1 formylmethanofuran dehydrogenase subunit E [Desulfosarcina ovata subsp. ovata]
MESFETLLAGSARAHGHLCPGQVVGVRMAMLGCELIGLDNPSQMPQIKKLVVYVEIDRCATDAIAYVTGVKLGRRSLKFLDNGIMAATFVNLETGVAYRIVSTESSRDLACEYAPGIDDIRQQQLEGYKNMPDHVLFNIMPVHVDVPVNDMPGPSRFKIRCESCGIMVRDKKEVLLNGRVLCRSCAYGAHYEPLQPNLQLKTA